MVAGLVLHALIRGAMCLALTMTMEPPKVTLPRVRLQPREVDQETEKSTDSLSPVRIPGTSYCGCDRGWRRREVLQ